MNDQLLNEVVNSQTAGIPVVKADVLPKNIKPVQTQPASQPVVPTPTSAPTPVVVEGGEDKAVQSKPAQQTQSFQINEEIARPLYEQANRYARNIQGLKKDLDYNSFVSKYLSSPETASNYYKSVVGMSREIPIKVDLGGSQNFLKKLYITPEAEAAAVNNVAPQNNLATIKQQADKKIEEVTSKFGLKMAGESGNAQQTMEDVDLAGYRVGYDPMTNFIALSQGMEAADDVATSQKFQKENPIPKFLQAPAEGGGVEDQLKQRDAAIQKQQDDISLKTRGEDLGEMISEKGKTEGGWAGKAMEFAKEAAPIKLPELKLDWEDPSKWGDQKEAWTYDVALATAMNGDEDQPLYRLTQKKDINSPIFDWKQGLNPNSGHIGYWGNVSDNFKNIPMAEIDAFQDFTKTYRLETSGGPTNPLGIFSDKILNEVPAQFDKVMGDYWKYMSATNPEEAKRRIEAREGTDERRRVGGYTYEKLLKSVLSDGLKGEEAFKKEMRNKKGDVYGDYQVYFDVTNAFQHQKNVVIGDYRRKLSEGINTLPETEKALAAIQKTEDLVFAKNPHLNDVKSKYWAKIATEKELTAEADRKEAFARKNSPIAAFITYNLGGKGAIEGAKEVVNDLGRVVNFASAGYLLDEPVFNKEVMPTSLQGSISDKEGFHWNRLFNQALNTTYQMGGLLIGTKGAGGFGKTAARLTDIPKIEGILPMFTAAAFQSFNDYKDPAKQAMINAGYSEDYAEEASIEHGLNACFTMAALENFVPLPFSQKLGRAISNDFSALLKKGGNPILAGYKAVSMNTKNIGVDLLKQYGEEAFQQIGDVVNNAAFNNKAGMQLLDSDLSYEGMRDLFYVTAASTILARGASGGLIQSPSMIQKATIFNAIKNPEQFNTAVDKYVKDGRLKKEEATSMKLAIQDVSSAMTGLPEVKALDDRQKLDLAFLIYEKKKLKEEVKSGYVDEIFREQKEAEIAKKTAKYDKSIMDIYNKKTRKEDIEKLAKEKEETKAFAQKEFAEQQSKEAIDDTKEGKVRDISAVNDVTGETGFKTGEELVPNTTVVAEIPKKNAVVVTKVFEQKPVVNKPEFKDEASRQKFAEDNQGNIVAETVSVADIIPTQKKLDKTNTGGEGKPLLVRTNEGLFVLDGHHTIANQIKDGTKEVDADIIDLTNKIATDDTKDKTGLPSEVGVGQESIQAQPIEKTGAEATTTGGDVQASEKVTEVKLEAGSVDLEAKKADIERRRKNAIKSVKQNTNDAKDVDATLENIFGETQTITHVNQTKKEVISSIERHYDNELKELEQSTPEVKVEATTPSDVTEFVVAGLGDGRMGYSHIGDKKSFTSVDKRDTSAERIASQETDGYEMRGEFNEREDSNGDKIYSLTVGTYIDNNGKSLEFTDGVNRFAPVTVAVIVPKGSKTTLADVQESLQQKMKELSDAAIKNGRKNIAIRDIDSSQIKYTHKTKTAEQSATQAKGKEKTIADKTKNLADKIRKYKTVQSLSDMNKLKSDPLGLFKGFSDGVIESVATTIEVGGKLAQSLSNAMASMKGSKWYNDLSAEGKKKADEMLPKTVQGIYREHNLTKRAEKKGQAKGVLAGQMSQGKADKKAADKQKKVTDKEAQKKTNQGYGQGVADGEVVGKIAQAKADKKAADKKEKETKKEIQKKTDQGAAFGEAVGATAGEIAGVKKGTKRGVAKGKKEQRQAEVEKRKEARKKEKEKKADEKIITKAEKLRDKLRTRSKNKDFVAANDKAVIDLLLGIDPRQLSGTRMSIMGTQDYIDIATALLGNTASGKVRTTSNKSISDFVESASASVKELSDNIFRAKYENVIEAMIELEETYIDDDGNKVKITKDTPVENIQEVLYDLDIDARRYKDKISETNRERMTASERSTLAENKAALGDIDKSGFDAIDKKIIDNILKINENELDFAQAAMANNVITNIIINGNTTNAGRTEAIAIAQQTAVDIKKILDYYGIESFGNIDTRLKDVKSVAALLKQLAGSNKAAAEVRTALKIQDLSSGYTNAMNEANQAWNKGLDGLTKKYKRGIIRNAENRHRQGMYAILIQNEGGSTKDQDTWFKSNKDLIKEDIRIKEASDDKNTRKEAVMIQKIYDELFADATTLKEAKANMSKYKGDKAVVELAMDVYGANMDAFRKASLVYGNNSPKMWNNYTHRKWKKNKGGKWDDLSLSDATGDMAYGGHTTDNVNRKEAKTSKGRNKVWPDKDKILNLDFFQTQDKAISDSYYQAKTLGTRYAMKEIFNNKDVRKLLGVENHAILKDRVISAINTQLGISSTEYQVKKTFDKVLRFLIRNKVVTTLGGPFAFLKQAVSALFGAYVRTGFKPSVFAYMGKKVDNNLYSKSNVLGRVKATKQGGMERLDNQSKSEINNKVKKIASEIDYISENIGDVIMKPLSVGDNMAAKAAWMAYYKKSMKDQGQKSINWKNEALNPNEKASAYADQMIETSMNVNDMSMAGDFFKNPANMFKRAILTPYASFSINQDVRIMDATKNLIKPRAKGARSEAASDFGAVIVEQVAFQYTKMLTSSMVTYMGAYLLAPLLGADEEEQDEIYKSRMKNIMPEGMVNLKVLTNVMADVLPIAVLTSPVVANFIEDGVKKKVNDVLAESFGFKDKDGNPINLLTTKYSTKYEDENFRGFLSEEELSLFGILGSVLNDVDDFIAETKVLTLGYDKKGKEVEMTDYQKNALRWSIGSRLLGFVGAGTQETTQSINSNLRQAKNELRKSNKKGSSKSSSDNLGLGNMGLDMNLDLDLGL